MASVDGECGVQQCSSHSAAVHLLLYPPPPRRRYSPFTQRTRRWQLCVQRLHTLLNPPPRLTRNVPRQKVQQRSPAHPTRPAPHPSSAPGPISHSIALPLPAYHHWISRLFSCSPFVTFPFSMASSRSHHFPSPQPERLSVPLPVHPSLHGVLSAHTGLCPPGLHLSPLPL